MSYKSIDDYSGSLYGRVQEDGIEYDWEVPDNLVVGTPGGVSTVHHHYTKGFDGRGNTSSDIYGGQGDRYIAGVYGNLYGLGQTAPQELGYYPKAPDTKYWNNETSPQTSYTYSSSNLSNFSRDPYPSNSSPLNEIDDSFELIGSLEDEQKPPLVENFKLIEKDDNTTTYSPAALFIIFLLVFIVFSLWAETGLLFMNQKIHKGKTPSWKTSLLYTSIITLVLILILWAIGIPLTKFESL